MSNFSSTYPSVSPTYQIDFSNGGRIPPNATFSRNDSPIDTDNAAASAVHFWSNEKHLSSENLLPYSNNLSSADWTKSRLTVDSVNNTAPDGGSDASLLLETADTGTHTFYDSFNCVSGQNYSFIFYAKPNGRTKLLFRPQATGIIASLVFDLSGSGTVTLSSGSTVSHSITQVGDYYKCQATVTATATGAGYTQVYLDNGSTTSYAGDVTKGVIFWGHQISSTSETVLNETSGQIARSYAPTLKSVSTAGQPRFEYDPTDGQSMGCLIEGQAQNLIARSDSIDNAYWTKSNCTVTAAAAVGVTGALNACLITESEEVSPATNVHSVYSSSFGLSSATSCTLSVYCKAAGVNRVQLLSTVGGSSRNVNFNIANGTVISESSATGAVEAVGDGVYRISITYTASATTNGRVYLILLNDSDASDYTGNGYNSVITSGFQFEQNSFASSLITSDSGSQTTRAADSLSVATADIGLTGGPFTVVSETEGGVGNYPMAFSLSNETYENRVYVYRNSSSADTTTDWGLDAVADGASVASTIVTSSAAAGKLAVSYNTNSVSVCASGGAVITDTAAPLLPAVTELQVGAQFNGTFPLNGHCKRIALYSEALSDTNLQALTS